jgi:hypothetical protein
MKLTAWVEASARVLEGTMKTRYFPFVSNDLCGMDGQWHR